MAFFPVSRRNIQHLSPQTCNSAGDLIAMCATSLWPLRPPPSKMWPKSSCWLRPARTGPALLRALAAFPFRCPPRRWQGLICSGHSAALWANSRLPQQQQPLPVVKENDLCRREPGSGGGLGGGWCPLAFGAARAGCAPRGGRAGSRPCSPVPEQPELPAVPLRARGGQRARAGAAARQGRGPPPLSAL